MVQLVFNTVALHRRDTAKMYGLDPERLPIEPWSSRSALLEALPWHFETTDVLLKERVREFGLRLDGHESKTGELVDLDDKRDMQEQLRKQMEGLAEHTFSTYEERLLFQKRSARGSSNASHWLLSDFDRFSDDTFSAIDNRKLNGRYLAIRAQFIQALGESRRDSRICGSRTDDSLQSTSARFRQHTSSLSVTVIFGRWSNCAPMRNTDHLRAFGTSWANTRKTLPSLYISFMWSEVGASTITPLDRFH